VRSFILVYLHWVIYDLCHEISLVLIVHLVRGVVGLKRQILDFGLSILQQNLGSEVVAAPSYARDLIVDQLMLGCLQLLEMELRQVRVLSEGSDPGLGAGQKLSLRIAAHPLLIFHE
jgi:hypothetical protein